MTNICNIEITDIKRQIRYINNRLPGSVQVSVNFPCNCLITTRTETDFKYFSRKPSRLSETKGNPHPKNRGEPTDSAHGYASLDSVGAPRWRS